VAGARKITVSLFWSIA